MCIGAVNYIEKIRTGGDKQKGVSAYENQGKQERGGFIMNFTGDFVLLVSGVRDNDRLVKQITENDSPIYYRSRYVPPYGEFNELKNLLLRVKSVAEVNEENVIAIDFSEWVGHETEDFFTIMLKFLHDQRDHWRYVFTASAYSRNDVKRLFLHMKMYLSGYIFEDITFRNAQCLEQHIKKLCDIEDNAAKMLADCFFRREAEAFRGFEMLDSVISELEQMSRGKRITARMVSAYFNKDDSLICLLCGKTVCDDEREQVHNI